MISVAVCDDNEKDIERILNEIELNFSLYAINEKFAIEKYFNPNKLLADDKIKKYDLIFLDIEMPELDGFTVAEILTEFSSKAKIVFVTSHNDFTFNSFKYMPLEFIRKSRLKDDFKEKSKYIFSKVYKLNDKYTVVNNDIYLEINISEIVYIENDGNNIIIRMENNTAYNVKRKTLNDFINETHYENFVRIHTSYAVNIKFVYSPPKYDNLELYVNDKIFTLPVGRKYKDNLKNKFLEYSRRFML